MLFLPRSFALFIAPDGITDFGIALAKHCNLVFCSFILRIDWSKPFLTDYAITYDVNGLNSFICLRCNTTMVTIGRKVRFHHTLPFMTKQRCSSAAATSRLHQNVANIDTSVATSDNMTSDVMFSDKILMSDVDWVVFFHISSHFRTKIR